MFTIRKNGLTIEVETKEGLREAVSVLSGVLEPRVLEHKPVQEQVDKVFQKVRERPRSYKGIESKLGTEPARKQGLTATEWWARLGKADRAMYLGLLAMRGMPHGVPIQGKPLARAVGVNGSPRGLSGFSQHLTTMCRAFNLPKHEVYVSKGNPREWFAMPRIDEAIRKFSGLTVQEVLDAATTPDKK